MLIRIKNQCIWKLLLHFEAPSWYLDSFFDSCPSPDHILEWWSICSELGPGEVQEDVLDPGVAQIAGAMVPNERELDEKKSLHCYGNKACPTPFNSAYSSMESWMSHPCSDHQWFILSSWTFITAPHVAHLFSPSLFLSDLDCPSFIPQLSWEAISSCYWAE